MSEDISDRFPLQYDEVADRLNAVYVERSLEHGRIPEIGRAVDPTLECVHYPKTRDYSWRCGLVYALDGARIIVLFPWRGQSYDPPVAVRSSARVDSSKVAGLLEKLVKKIRWHQLIVGEELVSNCSD